MTVADRVAAHYERRAVKADGTVWAYWYRLWSEKALAGHQNPLTRRVARITGERLWL